MGDMKERSPGSFVIWTGGKPKADWSGLEDKRKYMPYPGCVRPTRPSDMNKMVHQWTTPSPTLLPFTASSNLREFALDTHAYFTGIGCDTIFHVPSPGDANVLTYVLTEYDKTTLRHTSEGAEKLKQKWDEYDSHNDYVATTYLMNRLDSDLKLRLRTRMDHMKCTAAELWMGIIRLVLDGSIERFERQRTALKKMSPLQEPGENVSSYTTKALKVCDYLYQAGQWDWTLCLAILTVLCKSTVEAFRAAFHHKRLQADRLLKECGHMSFSFIEKEMTAADLHYHSLFGLAEDTYLSLDGNDEWDPNKNVRDRTGAPEANNTEENTPFCGTLAEFNALVQSTVEKKLSGLRSDVICYKCNNKGHFARDCPTPGTGGNRNPSGTPGSGDWKKTAPAEGGQQTITKGDSSYHWCQICRRWNSTHLTGQHAKGLGRGRTVPNTPSTSGVETNNSEISDGFMSWGGVARF
jgi:hypothetical protein